MLGLICQVIFTFMKCRYIELRVSLVFLLNSVLMREYVIINYQFYET